MELEKGKKIQLMTALDRLKESLDDTKIAPQQFYTQIRDSIIKRFEFCFDLFWKCLKEHLLKAYGIVVASPRPTFREAFQQSLLDMHEFEQCEKMLEDRNNTSHRYDEEMSEDIMEHVFSYHQTMSIIAQRLD